MFLCFISFYTGKNACNIVSNAVDRGYKTIESSSLASLQCSNSDSRPDILIEVQQTYRIQMMGLTVIFVREPAHIDIKENKMSDKVAKEATKIISGFAVLK